MDKGLPEWRERTNMATPNSPGVVGVHAQCLSHAGDVHLQPGAGGCLEVHAAGFVEVPGGLRRAVPQVALMEFQNPCKET